MSVELWYLRRIDFEIWSTKHTDYRSSQPDRDIYGLFKTGQTEDRGKK